jgi:hypothetical protein
VVRHVPGFAAAICLQQRRHPSRKKWQNMAMRKTQETYRAHEDTEDGRPGTRPGRFQLHMRVSGRILRGAPKKKTIIAHKHVVWYYPQVIQHSYGKSLFLTFKQFSNVFKR